MTKLNLRPVAEFEQGYGHIVTVRGLEVGIDIVAPVETTIEELQNQVNCDPSGQLASILYLIGLASRDPQLGHGHVWLEVLDGELRLTVFRIKQTDWSRYDRKEEGYDGEPDILLLCPSV